MPGMWEKRWSDAGMALALLMLGLVLCLLGAGLLAQWEDAATRRQDASVEVLLAVSASAAGAGLLLWWAVCVLSAGAAILLQHLGRRRAAAAARRLSPAFIQRAVVAALSLQLLTGVAANAAAPAPGPEWTPTQAHPAPSSPDFAVEAPSLGESGQHNPGADVGAQPVPDTEAGAPHGDRAPARGSGTQLPASPLDPGWRPAPLVVDPGLLAAPEARSNPGTGSADATGAAREVTVLAGDTLWEIVAAHLGPEASDVDIALEWPRWYAANRHLIGSSPDVLLPGQILQVPAAS